MQVFNAGDAQKWPYMDRTLAEQVKYRWFYRPATGRYELQIASNPRLGLRCETGERVGIDIGVTATMDEKGHEKYISIFEPNRFFDLVLQ